MGERVEVCAGYVVHKEIRRQRAGVDRVVQMPDPNSLTPPATVRAY